MIFDSSDFLWIQHFKVSNSRSRVLDWASKKSLPFFLKKKNYSTVPLPHQMQEDTVG